MKKLKQGDAKKKELKADNKQLQHGNTKTAPKARQSAHSRPTKCTTRARCAKAQSRKKRKRKEQQAATRGKEDDK
jgi:hypothetical protein